MQHGRYAYADGVDLGEEPPLLTEGLGTGTDRRKVSLRWLTGTVLTGMTSAFLMGGALFVALDGRHTLAATPIEMFGGVVASNEEKVFTKGYIGGALQKSDRLRVGEQFATRQVLNLSTMTRVGDKDLISVKPFVRVSASLSMKRSEATANIPAFDPLKVFADTDMLPGRASASKNPAFYDAMVEGQVALRTSDLSQDPTEFDPDVTMAAGDVERIVRDQARFLTDGTVQVAALPTAGNDRFELSFGASGLNSALALRIVPENVSFFAKSDAERDGAAVGNGLDDKMITVDAKDTLKSILTDNQADDKQIGEITKAFARSFNVKQIEAGQRLRVSLAKIDQTEKMKPVRLSLYTPAAVHIGTVALSDEGNFVAAQEPDATDQASIDPAEEDESIADPNAAPSLYYSLYQTAIDNQIPASMVKDLVQIYSYDVDFNGRVKPGDTFELFYAMPDEADPNAPQEILYTAINVRGQLKRFYRYRSPDDGTVDFYDESGKSAKKFLMRKPMDGGVFRSGFGGRRHPILGYYRMHTGVDWAAPIGTPILASGNGTVEDAGWKGGYGRYVRLQHNIGYETGYGHMSGFAKGIEKGAKVRQGQVIGYVGSTGMSTGPHLHYEVLINQAYVDPMRVRLPRGKELGGSMLADFSRERDRIDTLMTSKGAPSTKVAKSN